MKYYKDLIQKLNDATKAYDEGKPVMSDKEWDDLYFTLKNYEEVHGFSLPESPTRSIPYEVVNELRKVTHSSAMLSLEKTKSIEELQQFIGKRAGFISLKLDGLTCRLTYEGGRLIRAETRGNGTVGEDITHNALVIPSIPNTLKVPEDLVIDGEVICTHKDFLPFSEEYKNPRNFAAGSIRLLDARECAKRNLTFVAWEVVKGMEKDNCDTHTSKLLNLTSYSTSFLYVPFIYVNEIHPIKEAVNEDLVKTAQYLGYPIDGLVLKFDDIEYGRSLGATAHHWRNGIAYKFYDETYETNLLDIEWTMGRTGALTPVAIFEPVEIDGTEVSRANMFNISVMKELLGIPYKGQPLEIYKANQIIPQVKSSQKKEKVLHNERIYIAAHCPYCGCETWIDDSGNTSILRCGNSACTAKLNNKLEHFCGKKGLDIKGLSSATIDKLITWGWVEQFSDFYELHKYAAEWKEKAGFGENSVSKILNAIEESRLSTFESFVSAIGIPLVGRTMVKELIKNGINSYEDFREKVNNRYDFSQFYGFGYEKSESILNFDYTEADRVYQFLKIREESKEEQKEKTLAGLNIVITGTLKQFKNRSQLQQVIEAAGGKVVGSISRNTNYLINNDVNSTSAKNQAAKKLGIPIISELEFLEMI